MQSVQQMIEMTRKTKAKTINVMIHGFDAKSSLESKLVTVEIGLESKLVIVETGLESKLLTVETGI